MYGYIYRNVLNKDSYVSNQLALFLIENKRIHTVKKKKDQF